MTAAEADPSARWLYTAGKEGSIVKWDLHTGRQVHTFHKSRPNKGKGKGKGKAKDKDKNKNKGNNKDNQPHASTV